MRCLLEIYIKIIKVLIKLVNIVELKEFNTKEKNLYSWKTFIMEIWGTKTQRVRGRSVHCCEYTLSVFLELNSRITVHGNPMYAGLSVLGSGPKALPVWCVLLLCSLPFTSFPHSSETSFCCFAPPPPSALQLLSEVVPQRSLFSFYITNKIALPQKWETVNGMSL